MSSSIVPFVFSFVFLLLGVGICLLTKRTAEEGKESLSWPTVQGEITHSGVDYERTNVMRPDGSTHLRTNVVADITYSYKVNGMPYVSNRVAVISVNSGLSGAQAIANRYPDKSPVKVYYNPSDPSRALLEPGVNPKIVYGYIFGVAFAAAGIIFALLLVTGHIKGGKVHVYEKRSGIYIGGH